MIFRGMVFTITGVLLTAAAIGLVARHNEPVKDPAREHREHIVALIEHSNPELPEAEKERLTNSIFAQAERLELPENFEIDGRPIKGPYLVAAFIKTESAFHRYAVSVADARGYMQIKPDTVAYLDTLNGTNTSAPHIFESEINLARGVEYISYLAAQFDSIREVCLAYNAGPGSMRKGIFIEKYWESIRDTYRLLETGELPDKQWDYDARFADHYEI